MMKRNPIVITLRWLCFLWLGCLFGSIQAEAVTTDPIRQLVKEKPVNKPLRFSPTFEGRGDGVHTCPVTGERVTKKSLKAEYFGRTVYFCCEGCLHSARRMPEKYVKPTMAEQVKAAEAYIARVPKAPSGEEFCNE